MRNSAHADTNAGTASRLNTDPICQPKPISAAPTSAPATPPMRPTPSIQATPVARPVIYTLVGCVRSERCIVERTETGFLTREDDTCAANDWVPCRLGWEGRIGMRRFLVSSFADAAGYSRARRESLAGWNGLFSLRRFDWVRAPVLNPYTRLAVVMSPGRGILRVIGYDYLGAGGDLPVPVTQACELELLPRPMGNKVNSIV